MFADRQTNTQADLFGESHTTVESVGSRKAVEGPQIGRRLILCFRVRKCCALRIFFCRMQMIFLSRKRNTRLTLSTQYIIYNAHILQIVNSYESTQAIGGCTRFCVCSIICTETHKGGTWLEMVVIHFMGSPSRSPIVAAGYTDCLGSSQLFFFCRPCEISLNVDRSSFMERVVYKSEILLVLVMNNSEASVDGSCMF